MATQNTKERWYPQHALSKPVNPEQLNHFHRITIDQIYDVRTAVQQMTGGGTGLAIIGAGAVTGVFVMFPGFGYTTPPAIVITGGGGAGAKATATIKQGRISAITVTAGGAGYTSTPTVTITP